MAMKTRKPKKTWTTTKNKKKNKKISNTSKKVTGHYYLPNQN